MLAEAYSEWNQTSEMELLIKIISSFRHLIILAKYLQLRRLIES